MKLPTDVERADIETTQAAATVRKTAPIAVLGWLSEAADQPQLISICAATALLGVATGRGGLARTGLRMLAAELVATRLKSLVKHRVDRTRPRVIEDGGTYRMDAGSDPDSDVNSFPSGHTAGAVAVARVIAGDHPQHRAAAYATAAAVAAIQVPRCQHYPTDLAAGAILGLLAEAIVRSAERRLVSLVGHR